MTSLLQFEIGNGINCNNVFESDIPKNEKNAKSYSTMSLLCGMEFEQMTTTAHDPVILINLI